MASSGGYLMEVGGEDVNTIIQRDGRTTWTCGNVLSQIILNVCDRIISLYMHFCLVLTAVEDLKE